MPHILGFKGVCLPSNSEFKKGRCQNMYAIIETGGKQKDDVIFVEKLPLEEGASVDFKVIAFSDGSSLKLGNPYINSAKVSAKVLKNGKGKKITVFTYKPKKHVSRKLGHRQPYTKVQIQEITA